jgi:cytochrome c biogenesis protein CcmG, thiol:disulfide interchange protein DsbE
VKRWIVVAIAAATACTLLYVFYAGFGTNPHEVPFMLAGSKAPLFTMKRLDTGEDVQLKDFIGKPIVLNFWATWCGPCKMEHPSLEWGYRKYGRDVVFLGVVFEDSEENTKKFIAENGGSFLQLFDPKSTVAVDYGVAGVPETYFINKAGTIVGKYPFPIDPPTLAKRIEEIL